MLRTESHTAIGGQHGKPVLDKNGEPVIGEVPRYNFHALRHVVASLFIEQGWSPKKIQTVMGHSTIQMTFDTYGRIFANREPRR